MFINGIQFNNDLEDIMDELIAQLRINHIPLLPTIKYTPDDIMVCCPYHKNGQERKPSMGIRKSDGLCHCFTCGETHSLQEMISHCFGKDDAIGSFGWTWLLKNFLTVEVDNRKPIELNLSRGFINKSKVKIGDTQEYVSEKELDSYRYYHPYMYKRRLTNEVIEIFDIGFDKATNCITFPVRNLDGKTLFVARRNVNTKYFNYPSGVEKPLYGLYELYSNSRKEYDSINKHILYDFPNEVIVCESMLDATTAWVYGKYAVALNGLGTDLQFKQLMDLPCRKLILATDNDSAGMKARARIRKNVKNKLISEYLLPDGKKDLNDLTKDEFDALEEVF